MYPGQIACTRIPSFPWSIATALVNARIAPLVAQYPAHAGSAKKPLTDDMLIITPRVLRKSGRKEREHRKTPPTFTAICLAHSSGVVDRKSTRLNSSHLG